MGCLYLFFAFVGFCVVAWWALALAGFSYILWMVRRGLLVSGAGPVIPEPGMITANAGVERYQQVAEILIITAIVVGSLLPVLLYTAWRKRATYNGVRAPLLGRRVLPGRWY